MKTAATAADQQRQKKMNSKSFDIQSIYAMKNVDFVCCLMWSRGSGWNIFLCIKWFFASKSMRESEEQKHKQQFSVQKKQVRQKPAKWIFIQEEFLWQKQRQRQRLSCDDPTRLALIFRFIFDLLSSNMKSVRIAGGFLHRQKCQSLRYLNFVAFNARLCAFYFSLRN